MSKEDSLTITIVYNNKLTKLSGRAKVTLKELKNYVINEFELDNQLEKLISFCYKDNDGDINFIENDKDIEKFKEKYSYNNYLLKLELIINENIPSVRENNEKKQSEDVSQEIEDNNQIENDGVSNNLTLEEKKKQLLSQIKQEKEKNKKELEKISNDYDKKIVQIMQQQQKEIETLEKQLYELKQENNNKKSISEKNPQQEINNSQMTENILECINEIFNNFDMESEIKEINNFFDDSKYKNEVDQLSEELSKDIKENNQKFVNEIDVNYKNNLQMIQGLEKDLKEISKNLEIEAVLSSNKNSTKNDKELKQSSDNNQNNKIKTKNFINKQSDNINNISSKNSKEIKEGPKDNIKKNENKLSKIKENKNNNQEFEDIAIGTEEGIKKDINKKISINNSKNPINDKNNLNSILDINKANNDFRKQTEKQNKMQSVLNPNIFLTKKEKPLKSNNMINLNNIPKKEMKKEIKKGYELIKNIFFADKYFKEIRKNEPNEKYCIQIADEIQEENKNGESTLKNFCLTFIEKNVVSYIRKCNDDDLKDQIIKRMQHVLEFCCGVDKNIFQNEIIYNTQVVKYNRHKSVEGVRRFREEFGIGEDVYSDEAITRKLIQNNYDINKVLQDFYG